MKILYRYLLGALVLNLLMTLAIFTFVLLLGNTFKDVVSLLSNQSVGVLTIFHFFVLMLPFVLSFSMPMALMAATLLAMGRLSADNELTAARACGVSFIQLVLPVLGVASLGSFFCLYVNADLAPKMKYQFNQAFLEIAFRHPIALLEEGQYLNFGDARIFIAKRDIRHQTLKNVRIMKMQNDEMVQDVHAERGVVTSDTHQMKVRLTLYNATIDQRDPSDPDSLEKRKWAMTAAEYPYEIDIAKLVDSRRAVKEVHHYTSIELWRQALELKGQGIHPTPMLVELHKRNALSVACIAFVLIALPLGIQVQRRETSVGILISLVLAVFYYFLIILAESFKNNPHVYPEFIVWIPNLVFEGVGLYLLWKQQRA